MTRPINNSAAQADAAPGEAAAWRRWLAVLLLTTIVFGIACYAGTVLIDPFSTGRFALTQRVDVASDNPRLYKIGIARDPRFDAAIFGSSTSDTLNPQAIGRITGWTVAQLGMAAALPPNQLTTARAFQRYHAGRATLQIHVLDKLWCRPGDPAAGAWGPFPDWLFEGSDTEYLSRILFPEAFSAAVRRVGIWIGLAKPVHRDDGYAAGKRPQLKLAQPPRPTSGPAESEPMPALDLLAAHVAALPAEVIPAFVFAPEYVNALAAPGSQAERRLMACKARVRQIADSRPRSGYLDLMTDNEIARNPGNYTDDIHYTQAAAVRIEAAIAGLLTQRGLTKK
jgi:hypothetical protein